MVLSILSIASAVALPAIAGFGKGGADDVVQEIASAYRAARGAAVSRGSTATVTVELATGTYWVTSKGTLESEQDTLRHGRLLSGRSARLWGGREGWLLTTFDSLGRARGPTLYISEGRDVYEVRVDPRTGAIDARAK